MEVLRKPTSSGFAYIVFVALAFAANADVPGKHPYYLHALSDLRTARWLMEHQPGDRAVSSQEDVATTDIDAALADIKRASIDDGKDIHDHVPVDAPNELPGHLHKALELLHHAHADIAHEEDEPVTRGLRNRAIKHVDAAIHATERAISDLEHQR